MSAMKRVFGVSSEPKGKLFAVISCPDGKQRNMGRVDRKIHIGKFGFYWAPRAHWYRYITFPRLAKKYGGTA